MQLRRMRRFRIVPVAQALFVLLFIALAVSNFQLRRQITAMRTRPAQNRFFAGESLPRFEARDAADGMVALGGAAQRDTVMILFAPGCEACDVVLDQVAATPRPNVTVVSLLPRQRSQTESRKVAGKVPLYFVDRVQRSPIASRAHVVPQILRIGAGGRVEEVCTSYPACMQLPGS
jgi:hypothetical protein